MPSAAKRITKSAQAYRSIGEAAEELGLQTHVLRYWETKFPRQLKPVKRPDGRRMFRPEDIETLKAIQLLVHKQGMTLKGAAKLLSEHGSVQILNEGPLPGRPTSAPTSKEGPARELQKTIASAFSSEINDAPLQDASQKRLETVLADLQSIKARLDAYRVDRAA
ncbi:MerR family transcriptional regulator [Henriciella litoralis]|uniref:MerR family transcriptional regulator n=1 Tax=Henriciella litoralis TaxID=568102 RepID=UPI0009FD9DD3|nr:MerR family transcriptional regulator [Henriciella litoralis]